MSALRQAISNVATQAGVWPRPDPEPVSSRRAAAKLEQRHAIMMADPQADAVFLEGLLLHLPSDLTPRDLRRSLPPAWRLLDRTDPDTRAWVLAATDAALALEWRPTDRALLTAWLDVFPTGPGSEKLASAAAEAAGRHDWPYAEAGRTYRLWDHDEGPSKLGRALLDSDAPNTVLRGAALSGLPDAQIVKAAVKRVADEIALAKADVAARDSEALLDLVHALESQQARTLTARGLPQPAIVHAILRPWLHRDPPPALQTRIQRYLLDTVGDPRTQQRARWQQMTAAMAAQGYGMAPELLLLVNRWLIRASFELFFKLVMASTDNPQQWRRREQFWRPYLESKQVTDAWFILGNDAERQAGAFREEMQGNRYGRINGGGTSGQSALLMQIGDLKIAEWSDNGSCCFWKPGADRSPVFGEASYSGHHLRAGQSMKQLARAQAVKLKTSPLWAGLGHQGQWEGKFQEHIRNPDAWTWI